MYSCGAHELNLKRFQANVSRAGIQSIADEDAVKAGCEHPIFFQPHVCLVASVSLPAVPFADEFSQQRDRACQLVEINVAIYLVVFHLPVPTLGAPRAGRARLTDNRCAATRYPTRPGPTRGIRTWHHSTHGVFPWDVDCLWPERSPENYVPYKVGRESVHWRRTLVRRAFARTHECQLSTGRTIEISRRVSVAINQ